MWIDTKDIKYLLEHVEDMPSHIRKSFENQLERAEERQKEREEKKRQERYKLYDAIYAELKDGRSYTPTDLQLLLYNHTSRPWSCQKVTRLLFEMSYCLCGRDKERWPGVENDLTENCKRNNRGKSFFHIKK